ncbi:type VI secretion system-associated protein TagF [Bradyrhizobium sp. 2TAF24]|uniref:type VI secretion system-associated protein TagF n=1 Tax=Bradyrhizobium sp. 2TAF24 TaxID=3233011 RepID=UPI003F8E6A49
MTMRCGLFGKLGAKRDFIALATPRAFLEVWEPWLQASLSASRHELGTRWQQAFLTTPIWRFWLGGAICGTTVVGVIMPSLDGIGRYYPLTLHAMADAGTALPPPQIDAQDDWFAQAEALLLGTLDRDAGFERIIAALDGLAPPRTLAADAVGGAIVALGEAMNGTLAVQGSFAASFAALTAVSPDVYAAASFWWTGGGGDFPPLALCCRGLPDPFRYSTLLTGDLAGRQPGQGER